MIVDENTKIYVGDSRIKKVAQGDILIFPKGQIFGVRRQISSSSPVWERLEGGVGLVANATHDGTSVRNDFDELYPWNMILSYDYDAANDIITAWYGDDNFKFDGTNGDVLTKIPEFWWKRYIDDGYEYIYISTYPAADFNYSPEFSVARFLTSSRNNTPTSQGGASVWGGAPISYIRQLITTKSSKYSLLDYHYFLIEMLYLVEYANYNSQLVLGTGADAGQRSTGGCNSLGMRSGCTAEHNSVIYRGIEDIYANYLQMIDGLTINAQGYVMISYNPDDYTDLSKHNVTNINLALGGGGWPICTRVSCDEEHALLQIPTAVGGSADSYMCDGVFVTRGSSYTDHALYQVGGSYIYGNICGFWCVCGVNSRESTYGDSGNRFIKYK